ncbi:hypothetical protein AUP44_11770 [Tistrella mobilis]|uniref:Uncharacterized protein n=1 Tax=Tistrella mobilis TaxID=171437 RepID=A0A162K9R1_9PROT|nr:hypothetical protein AUP44_11770 [Tistrella mobilis]
MPAELSFLHMIAFCVAASQARHMIRVGDDIRTFRRILLIRTATGTLRVHGLAPLCTHTDGRLPYR